jgi:hypothetical protein
MKRSLRRRGGWILLWIPFPITVVRPRWRRCGRECRCSPSMGTAGQAGRAVRFCSPQALRIGACRIATPISLAHARWRNRRPRLRNWPRCAPQCGSASRACRSVTVQGSAVHSKEFFARCPNEEFRVEPSLEVGRQAPAFGAMRNPFGQIVIDFPAARAKMWRYRKAGQTAPGACASVASRRLIGASCLLGLLAIFIQESLDSRRRNTYGRRKREGPRNHEARRGQAG